MQHFDCKNRLRFTVPSPVNNPHASASDLFQNFEPLGEDISSSEIRHEGIPADVDNGLLNEGGRFFAGLDQRFNFFSKGFISGAGFNNERKPVIAILFDSFLKDLFDS